MKYLRKFSSMVFFIAAFYFLVFSFSGMAIAEQTSPKSCVKSCEEKKQVCFNLNPDRRLCENDYQNCLDSCKADGGSSSSSQKGAKSSSPAIN